MLGVDVLLDFAAVTVEVRVDVCATSAHASLASSSSSAMPPQASSAAAVSAPPPSSMLSQKPSCSALSGAIKARAIFVVSVVCLESGGASAADAGPSGLVVDKAATVIEMGFPLAVVVMIGLVVVSLGLDSMSPATSGPVNLLAKEEMAHPVHEDSTEGVPTWGVAPVTSGVPTDGGGSTLVGRDWAYLWMRWRYTPNALLA